MEAHKTQHQNPAPKLNPKGKQCTHAHYQHEHNLISTIVNKLPHTPHIKQTHPTHKTNPISSMSNPKPSSNKQSNHNQTNQTTTTTPHHNTAIPHSYHNTPFLTTIPRHHTTIPHPLPQYRNTTQHNLFPLSPRGVKQRRPQTHNHTSIKFPTRSAVHYLSLFIGIHIQMDQNRYKWDTFDFFQPLILVLFHTS